jgi:hexokinase
VNGEHSILSSINICVSLVATAVEQRLIIAARTKYDIIIDESSNKPGEQVSSLIALDEALTARSQSFEKMIAGLYLGEVFRLILCELIDNGDLFLGQNTYKLEKAYAFDTAFLSLMER